MRIDLTRRQTRVRFALAGDLQFTRRRTLSRYVGAALHTRTVARLGVHTDSKRVGRHGRHIDSEIDSIEQRPGNASAIACNLLRRTVTAAAGVAQPSTRTW